MQNALFGEKIIMDSLFVGHVPDFSKWGYIKSQKLDTPRPHYLHELEISITEKSPIYNDIIHEFATAIMSARLSAYYLKIWKEKVQGIRQLSPEEMEIIAIALARGICKSKSKSAWRKGKPDCNEDHFKGHIVEVLLYCLRIFLSKKDESELLVFEPPIPKASSATGGIDLMEIGRKENFYFHIWESKGTDNEIGGPLQQAAGQLCLENQTVYNGFMEAYRNIQGMIESDDTDLANFIKDLPRLFFSSDNNYKRLGGLVCTKIKYELEETEGFLEIIGNSVYKDCENCQVIIIKIENFPQFREDLYDHLWNIY